jgi:hypothetical protein
MASEDSRTFEVAFRPSTSHLQPSVTRTARRLFAFLNRSWRPLGRSVFYDRQRTEVEPAEPLPINEEIVEQAIDGDLRLNGIRCNRKVALESRQGSINITGKIAKGVHATLRAARGVTIEQGIGPHSVVEIVAGGDVLVCRAIGHGSYVTITSAAAEIDAGAEHYHGENDSALGTAVRIDGDVGENSSTRITAQGNVTIGGSVYKQANLDIISLRGTITIGAMEQDGAVALVTAGRSIHVRANLSPGSKLTAMAQDDITIGGQIEEGSEAKITSLAGSISIGQGLRHGANARLVASKGVITIAGAVERSATVFWKALDFYCPHQEGTIQRTP